MVFDQTCFNRLATHFNISMFGHPTMFDDVWSPNISRLDRPLSVLVTYDSLVARPVRGVLDSNFYYWTPIPLFCVLLTSKRFLLPLT